MPTRAETTGHVNNTTTRGIHMVVYQSWNERSAMGREIFNVYDSNQYREHVLTYGGTGLFAQTAEGTAVTYNAPVEGYLTTFTHLKYTDGLRFTEEMWGDDLNGVMEDSPRELGEGAWATEETTLANHFNNGFDSAAATFADGVAFFDTAHIRENGETYRNEPSTAADLSTSSVEAALIDYRNFRTGGGRRLSIKAKCLLVPPDLEYRARRIMGSSHTPENDTNAIQPIKGTLDVKVWDYLTDTNAWFILPDKKDHHLNMYTRQDFTTSDVVDFDSGDLKFKAVYRQSSGMGDPRGLYGSPGVG